MFRNYASCTLDMCADKTVVENFEKVFIALSDDWQALMAVRAIRSLITIAVANIYIYIYIFRSFAAFLLITRSLNLLLTGSMKIQCWYCVGVNCVNC